MKMTGPVIGVLGFQGDVCEHLAVLGRLGYVARTVRNASELDAVDALILPGGESATLSKLITSSGLEGPLRERLSKGMPAFGTCAGMILLASEVLDGRPDQHPLGAIEIKVRRNAFGRQLESFESELDVKGLDEPVHAVFIRAPLVDSYGSEVEILAEASHHDAIYPVVCRQGAVFVASFHPELTEDTRVHELFLDSVELPSR